MRAQSCLMLFDPMDCSPLDSCHRILQARILEVFAISYSRGSFPPRDQTPISRVSCIDKWILLPLSHLGSPTGRGRDPRNLSFSAGEKVAVCKPGRALTRNQINQSLDLAIPSL